MRAFKIVQYEIIIAIITSVGCSLTFLLMDKLSKYVAMAVLIIFVMLIILLILHKKNLEATKAQYKEELASKGKQVEKLISKKSKEELNEATTLLSKTVEFTTSNLRSISESMQKIIFAFQEDSISEKASQNITPVLQGFKADAVLAILQNLRILFESDTRQIDTTTYPHNFFKLALFEVEERHKKCFLHRTSYIYPEGLEPHEETESIDVTKNARSAHALAYKNQEIVIIEDIPHEAKKPENVSRWIDLRHNQHSEYKSMVCVPIVCGRRGTPTRRVLAILSIDTNRKNYFLEKDPNYGAFLGRILSPFRTILTIAILFHELQDKFEL